MYIDVGKSLTGFVSTCFMDRESEHRYTRFTGCLIEAAEGGVTEGGPLESRYAELAGF